MPYVVLEKRQVSRILRVTASKLRGIQIGWHWCWHWRPHWYGPKRRLEHRPIAVRFCFDYLWQPKTDDYIGWDFDKLVLAKTLTNNMYFDFRKNVGTCWKHTGKHFRIIQGKCSNGKMLKTSWENIGKSWANQRITIGKTIGRP